MNAVVANALSYENPAVRSDTAALFVKSEPAAVTLILPDQSEVPIPLAEIASRTRPVSTMPLMVSILSPRELRDLIAYLATLK